MSKYTMEVYQMILEYTEDNENDDIETRINLALPMIFNFDYPIWNESYRRILERKIVDRYFTREICDYPAFRWQLFLKDRLNTIMPYYNQLYATTVADYDYKKDHSNTITDIENDTETSTVEGSNNTTINNTVGNTIDTTQTDCNTPQARIGNTDYASFITENKGTNNQTTNGSNNNTIDSTATNTKVRTNTHNESGHNIPIADLVLKYRDTLINIDNLILEELHDLFMLIY